MKILSTLISTVKHYVGTAAGRAALDTAGLPAGSTHFDTDTPALYIWDGSAWAEHIATVQTGDTINISNIGGLAAHDAAASGNPVQMGGVYRVADPALADGDAGSLRVNAKGEALVALTGSSPADAKTPGAGDANALLAGFNGTNWDRWRNNAAGELLVSAARTASTNSSIQVNYNAKGIMVFLRVFAASGTGGLLVRIKGLLPVTGSQVILNASPTAITAVGTYAYELYPGSAAAAVAGGNQVNQRTQAVLPRNWMVTVDHNDSSSYTYSVEYSLIM